MTLPNLYVRKMHTVLCRNCETRVKGRDWYDFEWCVKHNTKLNLLHLQERMIESDDLKKTDILSEELFIERMHIKIESLNIKKAIDEISPFIKDNSIFEFWAKDYFKFLTKKILSE